MITFTEDLRLLELGQLLYCACNNKELNISNWINFEIQAKTVAWVMGWSLFDLVSATCASFYSHNMVPLSSNIHKGRLIYTILAWAWSPTHSYS